MSKGERGSKKISAFVNKLISMLNVQFTLTQDPRNNSCIGWADTPHTFVISDTN